MKILAKKKKYRHENYVSGIVVPSQTGTTVNLMVSQLTEKEAKDELCYLYDVLTTVQSASGDLAGFVDNVLAEETKRREKGQP